MRISIVNYDNCFRKGGINKVVRETASFYEKLGHELIVFHPSKEEHTEKKINANFTGLSSPIFRPPYNLSKKFVKELEVGISDFDPDIIHLHGYMNLLSHQISLALRKKFPEKKIIFSPHFDTAFSSRLIKLIFPIFNRSIGKRSSKCVDRVICGSQYESSAFCSASKINHELVSVIPLGVDFEPQKGIVEWSDTLNLVYCGNIIRRKRVDRMVRLIKVLKDKEPSLEICATIAGEGDRKRKLKALSKKIGVEKNITWRTFLDREEMKNLMQRCHFFVLLSDSEAFGISISEMLSLGRMAIVSENTALVEFKGETGIIAAKDPDNLNNIAEKILETKNRQNRVGPFSGRIRSWEVVARDYLKEYSRLVSMD